MSVEEDSTFTATDLTIRDIHAVWFASIEAWSGVGVSSAGDVTLTDTRLEDIDITALFAYSEGQITVEGGSIAGSRGVGGYGALAIQASNGGSVDATGLAITDTEGTAVVAFGTTVSLHGCVISGILPPELGGTYAVLAAQGASVTLDEGSTVEDVEGGGVLAIDEDGVGTSVLLSDSTLRDFGGSDAESGAATGLIAEGAGASVIGLRVTIEGVAGPALLAYDEGTLTCESCDLLDSQFAAAAVGGGGSLELTDVRIEGVTPSAVLGGGMGIVASGEGGSPTLVVSGAQVTDTVLAAVYLWGPGSFDVADSDLVGGAATSIVGQPANGNAVFGHETSAWDGSQGLRLQGNTLGPSDEVGVLLDSASATLDGNTWTGNTVDLVWQSCGELDAPEGWEEAPASELCAEPFHAFVPPETLEFYFDYEDASVSG